VKWKKKKKGGGESQSKNMEITSKSIQIQVVPEDSEFAAKVMVD
jgi:hypothetical protein